MNFIKKLLTKKTNYPQQVIDSKVLDILNRLDSHLTDHSSVVASESVMVIKPYKIGLFSQVLPAAKIVGYVLSMLPEGYAYIPRSIAFICEPDGTWCFRIAIREVGELDIDKCEMFAELLARTNDAR